MDEKENVIFQPQGDPAAGGGDQPPSDPNAAGGEPVADPNAAADPGAVPAEGEAAPAEGEASAEGTAEAAPADGDIPPEEPPSHKGLIKKILIGVGILIVIIFLVILLIPKNQEPKEVKLLWWGLWEDNRAVQVAIDDFERANPNISIEYVKQDPELYRSRLESRIKNGTGPDIFRYHNSWTPVLVTNKLLAPLSADVVSAEDFEKLYPEVMQTDLVQNGAIFGLPVHADTLAMFANTQLFEQAGLQVPQTWEEFVNTSRRITVKDAATGKIKTAGAALGTYNNISHASDIVSMLFVQQGIELTAITDPTNTKKVETALEFYSAFSKGDQSVWDGTLDESVLAFSRGNLGLFFGYSWDVFRIQRLNDKLQFKVYPVPGLQGGKNATIASYWVEGISSKSTNKNEALLFMKYLARKETMQKLYAEQSKVREFGELYPRTDLAETLKENEMVYPFVSQLPYAKSTYFASDTHDGEGGLNSALNAYLGNAVTSLANNEESSQSVVKTLTNGVSQVYKKYDITSK